MEYGPVYGGEYPSSAVLLGGGDPAQLGYCLHEQDRRGGPAAGHKPAGDCGCTRFEGKYPVQHQERVTMGKV